MKNKLFNKIIVYLSVIAIVTSCFVFSASATELKTAANNSIVDLMPASEYKYTYDGNVAYETQPIKYFNGVTQASWSWATQYWDIGFKSLVITIQVSSGIAPSRLSLIPYVGATRVTFNKVSTNGDIIQYVFNNSVSVYNAEIVADWNGSYSGRFNIVSFYGVVNDVYNVTKMAYRQAVVVNPNGMEPSVVLTSRDNTVDLPFGKTYYDDGAHSGTYWVSELDIGITQSRLNYSYIDSVTVLFVSTSKDVKVNSYLATTANITEWTYNTDVLQTFPVTNVLSFTSHIDNSTGQSIPIYYYTATVDVSGVDFSSKTLHFTFEMTPVGMEYVHWNVDYIWVKESVNVPPWYQVFFTWIKGFFTSENDNLVDQIVGAINGDQSQGDQVANDVGKLENGSNQLGQLTQDMQVDKPVISGDSVDISNISDPTANVLMATTMAAFWQSPTIVSILLFLCTVILISFVFFGKKG